MAKTEDSPVVFKVTTDFRQWLSEHQLHLDCTASELIRTSLLLAVPQIRANPALLRLVTLEQTRG
jgi:hypothetical protein